MHLPDIPLVTMVKTEENIIDMTKEEANLMCPTEHFILIFRFPS